MRKWAIILVLLFPAAAAFANPVNFDPVSWISYVVVLGSTFGAESSLVAVILFCCHMAIVPLFVAMFTGNLVMYFVIFRPILEATNNVPIAEAVIVVAEAVFIKMISSFESFQMEDFKGLKWRTAFISAIIGNAMSYYVGTIIVN